MGQGYENYDTSPTPPLKRGEHTHAPDNRPSVKALSRHDITERRKAEAEIQNRVKELEDFYDMAVGRELKMIELKEEIAELKEELERHKKDALNR